ncbi:MAG: hypothetical protein F6K14_09780 [Symploca sp. SIO2C1]|nr:hypothetical protein [Symploca sp. SIO2C1]
MIADEGYLAKTVELAGLQGRAGKLVLPNPIASLEQAKGQLWVSIAVFCLLGVGFTTLFVTNVTCLLTCHIAYLTKGTQKLASEERPRSAFQPQLNGRNNIFSSSLLPAPCSLLLYFSRAPIEICIRDNGFGIPPDIVDKVFDAFFTTKPPGEGTDLGLSINHDIIIGQHQGEINLRTQETIHNLSLTCLSSNINESKVLGKGE